jgi:hypothetical protein
VDTCFGGRGEATYILGGADATLRL